MKLRYPSRQREVKKVITELQIIADAIATDTNYGDKVTLTIPEFLLNPLFGGIICWINNRGWKAMANNNGEKVDAKPFDT